MGQKFHKKLQTNFKLHILIYNIAAISVKESSLFFVNLKKAIFLKDEHTKIAENLASIIHGFFSNLVKRF